MKQNTKQNIRAILTANKTILTVLIFAFTLAACTEKVDIKDPISMGESAPAFTLKSLDGVDVSLSNFSNKVVVLFFLGSSCPSCKAAAPSVQSMLVTPFASETNYMVLGLDQWNGNTAAVQAFKTATNVTFPLLMNAAGVATNYKTTYDRIVIIDKAGKIAFSGTQAAATDVATAKAKVIELLAK
ncbi:MAG: redoxin domain-containing protein [Paludibacter sp.]|nr:redoxin domain-containing protein [Paludibacter sp.]